MEKAKFEYSPLGKIFKEGLTDEEKKESTGVFKKLDDIHRTNREILRRTGNNNDNNDDDDDDDDDNDDDDSDNKKKPSKDKKKPSKDKKKPFKDKKKPPKDEKGDSLKYSSMYTFNKYKISELDKLISLESKFNYIYEFAQKLNKLYEVKPRNDANKAKKEEVYNNAGKRFNELLNEYKIFYNNFTKNKDANNFADYNPSKFNRSRRYDNRLFESTEEQPRTSTPNDEQPRTSTQNEEQLNDQQT